jgi:hypothetical protein
MIGFINTVRDYRQLWHYLYSTRFQFTVAHALGSSVFTSRILSTDLSQPHSYFNSQMTSSWHSLISFLPFPSPLNTEDSTQFSSRLTFCTSTASELPVENTVFSCRVLLCYLATRCIIVYREHSSYYCVFAGTGILSRCLAMGRYVTIYLLYNASNICCHITSCSSPCFLRFWGVLIITFLVYINKSRLMRSPCLPMATN